MTLKRVLIGLVILVVIAGGVLFVLDRTIWAPVAVSTAAPSAPTLAAPAAAPTSAPTIAAAGQPAAAASQPAAAASQPATASASTGATAVQSGVTAGDSSGTQLYQIDPAQSEVRYQVNETLFQDNRLNTAIGRTKGIAGELRINFAQPAQSQIGDIVIDISQFTSDESRRDNFIRRQGLESATYPTATFKTTSIAGLPDKVSAGDQITFQMTGDLTVKHTTKPVTWDVTLKVGDKQLSGSATTQILMSDFGVGPLKLPILATEDQVKLFFDFVAVPAAGG